MPEGYLRSTTGRFTISKVNRGRCYGLRFILVDNRFKEHSEHFTLRDARQMAQQIEDAAPAEGEDLPLFHMAGL